MTDGRIVEFTASSISEIILAIHALRKGVHRGMVNIDLLKEYISRQGSKCKAEDIDKLLMQLHLGGMIAYSEGYKEVGFAWDWQ